jgi:glycosyltransferase involved in cell wall biosynthesis
MALFYARAEPTITAAPMYVIAHNGSPIFGGGELGTVRLLAGLAARGHRVLMLFRDDAIAERAATYGIPTSVQRIGGGLVLTDAVRMATRLRRERPDALILTTFKKVFLAATGARMARVPRVVQRVVLQTDTPARRPQYRWALRHLVDAVALNASTMREPFLHADPGLDPAKVVTIFDGVHEPTRVAPKGAFRRELGIPADAPVIGTVARLTNQKRLERLIRALAALPPNVHCVIAGEGSELATLQSLASGLGVTARLHFPGFRRDLGDVFDAFDAFVICSDTEGMSNAMLEAMAFGVPVISTPVSGAAEALAPFPDGTAPGVIVGFSDGDIATAVRRLIEKPAEAVAMRDAGRRRARERFSFDAMLDRWEALLRA